MATYRQRNGNRTTALRSQRCARPAFLFIAGGLFAGLILLGGCASDGSSGQADSETTTTAAEEPTTTVAPTTTGIAPKTTTTVELVAVDPIASGCIGVYDGIGEGRNWSTLDELDLLFNDQAEGLRECWGDPPAALLEQTDALAAYCMGIGAGVHVAGDPDEDPAEHMGWCQDDVKTIDYLNVLKDRTPLLVEEGVEAWLAWNGPSDS